MVDEAHRRIRRAMLARNAASPKLRGQYKRSVHAARLAQGARDALPPPATGGGTSGSPPGMNMPPGSSVPPSLSSSSGTRFGTPPGQPTPPLVPPPRSRRGIAIVIFAAILPVLLFTAAARYALTLAGSINTATSNLVVTSVADSLRNGTQASSALVVPTNTPNAQGTIEPIVTFAPRPTDVVLPRFDRQEPFTMLLIGVDSRDSGVGDDNDFAHSDTLILAYVDPLAKHVNLLSIPRDLLVQQAGGLGAAKITDVYSNGEARKYTRGGVGLVWATIQQNFGITIDYFAQVDFNGFTKIINEVGGVTIDNPYPIKDDFYPTADYQFTRFYLPAGTVHLNGEEALEYARTRHGDNDYARNGRQQQMILGVREQAVRANLFVKAPALIDALGGSIQTDFPPGQFFPFASFMKDVGNGNITQYSLNELLYDNAPGPVPGTFYTGINWPEARKLAKQFSTPLVNSAAATAQVQAGANLTLKVTVENGTTTMGLAQRWSQNFSRLGYQKIEDGFIDAPASKKGKLPQTKIYASGANANTARALAKTMGLDPSAVDTTTLPPETPTGVDILVVLGKDAKEPSG